MCLCEPDPPPPDYARLGSEMTGYGGQLAPIETGWEAELAAAETASSGRARRPTSFQPPSPRAAAAQAAEAAHRAAAEAGEYADPPAATQLRCILDICNIGDTPMTFTTALQTHFATEDIPSHNRFVKALGLWGERWVRGGAAGRGWGGLWCETGVRGGAAGRGWGCALG